MSTPGSQPGVRPTPLVWQMMSVSGFVGRGAAFINDPSVVSDKRLDTPSITINLAAAQVTFRNNYALEPIGGGVNFFDGGVLEVSSPNIAGGAFTDITNPAVGGSFVTGGYNGTISTSFSNPIGGRMAWSQSSGGYINTVANLGPNVVGQTIQLRFRMCSDSSVTGTGWRIDNVSVNRGCLRDSDSDANTRRYRNPDSRRNANSNSDVHLLFSCLKRLTIF